MKKNVWKIVLTAGCAAALFLSSPGMMVFANELQAEEEVLSDSKGNESNSSILQEENGQERTTDNSETTYDVNCKSETLNIDLSDSLPDTVESSDEDTPEAEKYKENIDIEEQPSEPANIVKDSENITESDSEQKQAESQNDIILEEEIEEIESRMQIIGAKAEQFDATKPADFVFVIDSTGSMRYYIQSVRSNLSSFVNYLNEKNVNIRLAVIDFKDIIADGNDTSIVHMIDDQPWSNDSDKIIDQFNSIRVSGGGDDPETPTDAFAKIVDEEIQWRNDAQKFVFLLTDADYKDSSDSDSIRSMDECVQNFRENGVHVTVVGQLAYENHYENLFRLTGGKYIDINSSDYYKLMIEIADWVYDSLTDTDGDGLPDDWETNGLDTDNDGNIDLDLKRMGADPNVKDIFVEVDWMYQPYIPGHFLWIEYTKQKEINLHPSDGAMRMVYEQFKNHGINLHIDAGPDSTDYVTGKKWNDLSAANSIPYEHSFNLGENYENWNDMALSHFAKNRWSVFKYCVVINRYNGGGSSGIAENIPGQFFLVADVDGAISKKDTKLAGTFMHEMGHTLGLGHGGDDHINYKPNYLSIMNYLFQFSGLSGTNAVNYSEYVLPELDESGLDENRGVDPNSVTGGTGLGTKWYYEKENKFLWFKVGSTITEDEATSIAGANIDFNNNGTIENNVSVNLNKMEEIVLPQSTNDWNRLVFNGGLIGGSGDSEEEETTVLIKKNPDLADELEELTYDEALDLGLLGNPGDCEIQGINPERIYNNIDDQKIFITVSNLSTEDSSPELIVTSDLLDETYKSVLSLPGSKDGLGSIIVEIPVKNNMEEGIYSLNCELVLENGVSETKEEEIQVLPALVLELEVGESKEILPDKDVNEAFTWKGSNDVITISEDGKVIANKEGQTVVTGTTADNDQLVCIVKVIKKSENENQKEDTNSKPVDQKEIENTETKSENNNTIVTKNVQKAQQNSSGTSSTNKTSSEQNKGTQSNTVAKVVNTGDESCVAEYSIAVLLAVMIITSLLVRKKHTV